MAGSITPLPIMLEEEDRKIYEKLQPPKSMVVRYGFMKMVAELPYDGDAKPGCGSKLVIRTRRGIELGEMLTSTCPNAGCSKSVSRKEMLDYIDNSGGKDYPFTNSGKILRVATIDDLNEQARLDAGKLDMIKFTRTIIRELDLPMKLVDVEVLLGGERIIFYYTSEQWVDFREMVRRLAAEYQTRIEMTQVNARNEARLVADYEKCGQYCCCKSFLKVLKPVSMRSAKVQKATLDPQKISGRCGRLMCCLRYEDETYEDLRKRLPRKGSRVMTEDGPGTVIDSQILTQLVLVELDTMLKTAAYPLENITPHSEKRPERPAPGAPGVPGAPGGPGDRQRREPRRPQQRRPQPGRPLRDEEVESREGEVPREIADEETPQSPAPPHDAQASSTPVEGGVGGDADDDAGGEAGGDGDAGRGGGQQRRRRRRRRRRGGGGPSGGGGAGGGQGPAA